MRLFISWSGATSQQIAEELRKWLPLILPAVKPFITTADLEKGAKWLGEISKELDASAYGLVCLTPANLQSQWLAFEAGALSKLEGRVATVLFGVKNADVSFPLSMFQATRYLEADFRALVSDINRAVAAENRRDEAQLDALFPKLWPDLQGPIDLILKAPPEQPAAVGPVDLNAVAAEIMTMLRQQNSILSSPERFLAPVLDRLVPEPRLRFLGERKLKVDSAGLRSLLTDYLTTHPDAKAALDADVDQQGRDAPSPDEGEAK